MDVVLTVVVNTFLRLSFNAELEAELDDIGCKVNTYFHSDKDRKKVMKEVELHRTSKSYVPTPSLECDEKGILSS